MRLSAVFLLLFCLSAPIPALAEADTEFLSGIEDVPLMTGLEEDEDAGVVFDKPAGRIVEAVAAGRPAPRAILAFYRDTLPELGWKPEDAPDGALKFSRETEELSVSILERGDDTVVLFSLSPASQP